MSELLLHGGNIAGLGDNMLAHGMPRTVGRPSLDLRERRNLTPICQNLYRVASALGFAWREGELDFWQMFRARAFGYRRMFVRDETTGMFRQARRQDEAGAISVEAAARFGTQIPLEYAYAAWGKLAPPEAASHAQRAQLRGFQGVTVEDIRQLAALRCRALHYLEQQFTYKNRSIDKAPFDLTRLDQVAVEPDQVPLHRSLEDFLLLEHHAKHQATMLYLSQPAELRAQTGQTAIVRCEQYGLAAAAVPKPTVAQYTRCFRYLQVAKCAKESGPSGGLHATR